MKPLVRLLWTVPLLFLLYGCDRFTRFRLVSQEYGFSVGFPEKPVEHSDTNYQGLPKSLWTVERDASTEFYSAEATSYKEALNPSENWIPDQELLGSVGIQITDHKRFKLRAASNGREVPAIATTAKQLSTGAILSSIYIVDGRTLISITARTNDERQKAEFLESLRLLR
jgi:hypothetical protein